MRRKKSQDFKGQYDYTFYLQYDTESADTPILKQLLNTFQVVEIRCKPQEFQAMRKAAEERGFQIHNIARRSAFIERVD